ncbi:ATP-binding protein [Poseidonocella sp. HB161398]|uniref:ATP-binding protein n=1 Tax=Poseidonocella sp. HB161398 TaxID=2320855 RepID=UPI001107DFC2|nr:ATP-binding protein [Poseidonocella sp. HB161398]
MPDPELPEYAGNPFISSLPPPLSAEQAIAALTDLPAHSPVERTYPAHLRLHCVQRLGRYFDPLSRHLTLEAHIGALIRQGYIGRNPHTTDFIHRLHNSHARVIARNLDTLRHPVETTASGVALIGCSGIGKSRSIARILRLYPQTIKHDDPIALTQVSWLKLECPHKGSAKQLCISFFTEMDRLLGTKFQARHGGDRHALDAMVVNMAQVADRHALGLLVIDEIQHLMRARGEGREDLLNFLVTLINKIGLPVLLVGTPAALPVLQGAFRQARRGSGVGSAVWEPIPDNREWEVFIRRMWSWQWTSVETPLDDGILAALRDESQGILDVVIKLYMLVQSRAIQLGTAAGREERIDVGLIRHVAKQDLRLIAPMIDALRRNDLRALELYDDLVPLAEYVRQTLMDATMRLGGSTPNPEPQRPPSVNPAETLDDAALLAMLEQLGVAPDLAAIMLGEARLANPGASTLDLVGAISDRLKDRGPEAKPRKKRKSKAAGTAAVIQPDPLDLRNLLPEIADDAHDVFMQAGYIRPPLEDAG